MWRSSAWTSAKLRLYPVRAKDGWTMQSCLRGRAVCRMAETWIGRRPSLANRRKGGWTYGHQSARLRVFRNRGPLVASTANDIRNSRASPRGGLCIATSRCNQPLRAVAAIQLPGSDRAQKLRSSSPTYGEHRYVWQSAGHEVVDVPTLDAVEDDISVVIVTNPNNPDGRLFACDQLDEWRVRLAARAGFWSWTKLGDVVPEASISAMSGREGLIVLRSFGKFFGLAGLRLGFVLAPASIAADLSRSMGPRGGQRSCAGHCRRSLRR